jgi:hypothetical protein
LSTIPASAIVNILPGVISAGGTGLVLNGVMLTKNVRVPTGLVMSFASAATVGTYFGYTSAEYAQAQIYFNGFQNSSKLPGSLLIARYPETSVPAWLRSGQVSTLTLAQIKAISGSLTVTMDNYPRTASIDLSSATSYTAAATLIETALNAADPTEASVTGSIAPGTASFTASISDDIMTVTAVASGVLYDGAVLSGTGVTSGTQIAYQLTGTTGGVGTYAVTKDHNLPNSTSITAAYGLMTVTVIGSGTISVGQTVTGSGVTAATIVTALGTGSGLTGTYVVNLTQTVASETLTLKATALTVTYDSVSGAFIFTSGIIGAASTADYSSGSVATSLKLSQATGAVISQGADGSTPGAFMSALVLITQNWASFWTIFDPDDGAGNTNKLAFAAWTSAQNSRYVYICWDSDTTPTLATPATTSMGYLVSTNGDNYAGTHLIYDPSNTGLAPFIAGSIASVNFDAHEGRVTLAFRIQSGLAATVTNQQVAANLLSNGYNFIGAYATANETFVFYYNGSISGPFQWLDSYINQIWMNSQFQLDLVELLTVVNSIPYNTAGYALIKAACMTTIQQAVNFGAIRAGVTLSSLQIADVNMQAGFRIDDTLFAQGWFFLVEDAPPTTRQARQTPPCFFWYIDGQSVQQITLNSIELM